MPAPRPAIPDADYTAKGARILPTRAEVFGTADIVVQVLGYGSNDRTGKDGSPALAAGQVLDRVPAPAGVDRDHPRARRQGSHLVLRRADAADDPRRRAWTRSPRWGRSPVTRRWSSPPISCRGIFPMLTTAAGTITPARVLVIGAGVAGLQAIATAKRLGAVASAYDMRPAAKEQVQSLGGRFVELPIEAKDAQDARGYGRAQDESFYQRQRELLGRVVAESDVVITAAVIPGKKSPVLVTADMVARMAPGSVIVDLAAERGGNCELTRPGEIDRRARRDHRRLDQPGQHRPVSRQPDVCRATSPPSSSTW